MGPKPDPAANANRSIGPPPCIGGVFFGMPQRSLITLNFPARSGTNGSDLRMLLLSKSNGGERAESHRSIFAVP